MTKNELLKYLIKHRIDVLVNAYIDQKITKNELIKEVSILKIK